MWLFTPDGFYSAVQHKDDPDLIMVRARARAHAERLVQSLPEHERPEIVETPPPADYLWRVTLTRAQWVFLVAKFAADIAYLNFKSEAHKREHPPGYMSALHALWGDMLKVQDDLGGSRPSSRKKTKDQGSFMPRWTDQGISDEDEDDFAGLDTWLSRHEAPSDSSDEDEYDPDLEQDDGSWPPRKPRGFLRGR